MIKKEELKNIVYFDVETAGAYPTHDDLVQTNPRLAAELLRGTNADTVKNLRPYVKFYAQRKFEQEKK